MFGQVFDKLDSLFGRPFLLASFFPWLIFAVANAVMVLFMTPETAKSVSSYFAGGFYGAISGAVVFLGAVAAIAYVSDPLFLLMTRFLQGDYFPNWVARCLATDQSQHLRDLETNAHEAGEARAEIVRKIDSITRDIDVARDRGRNGGQIFDETLIDAANTALANLYKRQSEQQPISLEQLNGAVDALKRALERNTSDAKRLYDPTDARKLKYCNELKSLYYVMGGLITYAKNKSSIDHSIAVDKLQTQFAQKELPSTRFGNEAAALSGFFETRFELDFDFFWPIFQIVLQDDQKAADAVVQSRQQLEFSIRIFWFTAAFTAIWLAWAAGFSRQALVAPTIGTIGVLLCALWLEIVHTSYRSFAQIVRGVIILKRFDVLRALHLSLPETWKDEQAAWTSAAYQLKWGANVPVSYKHPEK